jgi:hypothetical protein
MRWSGRNLRGAGHLRHNQCQLTEISQSRNASTPTEPISTLLYYTSDHPSETGDYTDALRNCQALRRLGGVLRLKGFYLVKAMPQTRLRLKPTE